MSATGTYLDVPDDTVLRVAPGPTDPAELATRIAHPDRGRPELRARMGEAARAHMAGADGDARPPPAATKQAIDATLALVGDPAHKALAIWGKALADLGIDERDAGPRATALEYARALEDLRSGTLIVPGGVRRGRIPRSLDAAIATNAADPCYTRALPR